MSCFTTTTGLRIGHLNICSLSNKVSELKVLIKQHSPHIIGISESRIHFEKSEKENKVTEETLSIPGYFLFRRDISEVLHTGLAIYVHESVSKFIKRRLDLEKGPIECIWLQFKNNQGNPKLIGTFYRNPKSNLNDWIDSFVDQMDLIDGDKRNVTLLGDFNINLHISQPKWDRVLSLFNLKQLVTESTRITDTTSTLIDHVYTNNTKTIRDVHVVSSSISDHKAIFCTLSCKLSKPKKNEHTSIEYRCFKNFIAENFISDLNAAPFQSLHNETNADNAINQFLELFCSIVNKHAPLKQKRVKHQTIPPWMTKDIIDAMAHRDFLKENKEKEAYKKQRNKVSSLQTKARQNYFNSLIENDKSIITLWRAMNEILDKGRQATQVNTSQITPEMFNKHFISLAENIASQAEPRNNDHFHGMLDNLKKFCGDRLKARF